MSVWNRRMELVAWLGALASACTAQETPVVPPPPQRGVVIDDSELCLELNGWWRSNEERFLKVGSRRLPLSDGMVDKSIVPALRKALDSDSNDLVWASLMALARIGREVPLAPLCGDFARHVRHRNQEVRETAALALGVAGIDGDRQRNLLVQLVRGDVEVGAAAGEAPTLRTRAFATYGLGLLASGSSRLATQRTVYQTMQWVLQQERGDANLQVAAVHALSLLHLPARDEAAAILQTEVLGLLTDTWAVRSAQPGDLVACACPPAIGKLLGRSDPRGGELAARFVQELGRNLPTELGKPSVTQSCAIALGLLADPSNAAVVSALAVAAAEHPDLNARMFACLALGEVGGPRARGLLQQMLVQPNGPHPVYARGWAAVALGVAVRQGNPDAEERAAIDKAFQSAAAARGPARPDVLVAAGLAGSDEAVSALWARSKGPSDDYGAVAYCQALQLLGHREALVPLRALFESNPRRYELRCAAAKALASLGEQGLGGELIQGALTSKSLSVQCCHLVAAGDLAVGTEVDAVLQTMADPSRDSLLRTFAAVALGMIARRSKTSWSLPLGVHTNHLAAPPTLSNNNTGVLDLL